MKGQIISFWADEQEAKAIKDKARKQRRSVSNYIKCELLKDEK